jgi:type IV pilus assembly protein PilM
MLFFKPQHVVGLDIGTSSIKLVEIEKIKGTCHLRNFGIAKLSKDTIVNGTIIHSDQVVQAIKSLISNLNVKNKNLAISISGHPVIIKKITLPLMTEEELENTIELEAEQYIPFALDEVNIDFQILGVSEDKSDQMNVMLVAAKKAMIDEYTTVVKTAGLHPAIVDIDVFALENMFIENYTPEENASIALIDIGASVTNINILKNGTSQFTRDIFLAGNQVTEEIQRKLSVSYDEAETLKHGEIIEGINQELLHEVITKSSAAIAAEIHRSLDFYISSTYAEINHIYLSGGGSMTRGLKEALEKKTSIPLNHTNPFETIKYDPNTFDPDYIRELAPVSAVGVGLALRSVGE